MVSHVSILEISVSNWEVIQGKTHRRRRRHSRQPNFSPSTKAVSNILQQVDPLLGNGSYTRSKGTCHATIWGAREQAFSMWSAPRLYHVIDRVQSVWGVGWWVSECNEVQCSTPEWSWVQWSEASWLVSSQRTAAVQLLWAVAVRIWQIGHEGLPLEAVTRQWLVKTKQTEDFSAWCNEL
jgi:hypothetical protein